MSAGPSGARPLPATRDGAPAHLPPVSATMADVTGADFLELLARDAAAVEFEGPLLAARAAGADSDTLAGLEHAKALALQVRAVLESRRRRETELSALFETASDLAALTDLDEVLTAIVRRARALLHSDIAYLSLNDDENGDTPDPGGTVKPIFAYPHSRGGSCSIIGGYVVRDRALRSLYKRYVYADLCEGELRSLVPHLKRAGRDRKLGLSVASPSSFGEDARGHLYITSLDGPVYRLVER